MVMGGLDLADEAQFVSKRPSKRFGEWSLASVSSVIARWSAISAAVHAHYK